ncbi:MAG UNVERIFIED_CONTAM: hypothetical protein LVR29_10195 [Microcystis novacekii LVE1205-3]|jgi:hypothetical protein
MKTSLNFLKKTPILFGNYLADIYGFMLSPVYFFLYQNPSIMMKVIIMKVE